MPRPGAGFRTAGVAAAVVGLIAPACQDASVHPRPIAGADVARGRDLIQKVGCAACHETPGVRGPAGRVGPSLDGFAGRSLIAGRFPNQPEVLALWVRDAPALEPRTGMPAMPLSEQDARDVAAYLYTLDAG